MILAMIRHGQTDFNFDKKIQGHMDNKLNETGKGQARTLGTLLNELGDKFDIFGASPLSRARETAMLVGEKINMEVSFYDANFLERNFGPFDGRLIEDTFPTIMAPGFKTEGYEDDLALSIRIKNATMNLYQQYSDKKVLFVAHAHVIKALLIIADPNKYSYTNHYVGNSSIVYFNITEDKIDVIKQIDL